RRRGPEEALIVSAAEPGAAVKSDSPRLHAGRLLDPQSQRGQGQQGHAAGAGKGHQQTMTPGPLDRPLPGGNRAGPDRLAGEEPGEVVGEIAGVVITAAGLLLQTLQADCLQV